MGDMTDLHAANLIKQCGELQAEVESLREKFNAMSLIADDHAMARLERSEQLTVVRAKLATAVETLRWIIKPEPFGPPASPNGGHTYEVQRKADISRAEQALLMIDGKL